MDEHNIIEIKRGDEYRVFVENPKNICDKNAFFYPVYRKSAELVTEIISHSSAKNSNSCPWEAESPFFEADYRNNIIMYCAERGSGKSSAMYTFANALSNGRNNKENADAMLKLFDKNICDYSFTVLSPVDPTMISERDMFMRIILSKMFSKLRDKWSEDSKHSSSFPTGNIQEDKMHRAGIVKQFTRCYRYLDVIYPSDRKFDYNDDLEDLTDLGDSGRFKEEFQKLVTDFISEMIGRRPENKDVMIIPIDDADLNSKMAFNIVEDIRKYCIIPNVIILMAINIEQMYYVLEQHFVKDFKTLIDVSKNDSEEIKTVDLLECHRMAMRYVDKVLPAAHQIYLPNIDSFIRNNSSTLTIKYISKEGGKQREILEFYKTKDKSSSNNKAERITDYQELLLRLIYNKTGIALVKPESYLHNILPRTMRGLGHFLAYMSALPDLDDMLGVTEIYELLRNEPRRAIEEIIGKSFSDARSEIRKRVDNLDAFKQYFLKNWCTVRLSKKHCDVIETLENTTDGLKISVASKLIDELFPQIDTLIDDEFDPPLSHTSYAYIQRKINKLSLHAHETDNASKVYGITYAMRMYFMLFFNRLVLTSVNTGSFEKLLKNVNFEVWSPYNGKLEDHKDDAMFGRFAVNYKMLEKINADKPQKTDIDLKNNIFISENGKNSQYLLDNIISKNKAEKSLDKDSHIKLVFDYGTVLLYYAFDRNPYRPNKIDENVFEERNAVWTLLASYDLQRCAEKYYLEPAHLYENNLGSLEKILDGLKHIDYLPIRWNEIIQWVPGVQRIHDLQLTNKNIVLTLVDKWLDFLKMLLNMAAIDETVLVYNRDKPYDFPQMVNNLYTCKNAIANMKTTIERIIMICKDFSFSDKLFPNWNKLCDMSNYDPQKILDSQGTNVQDDAVNEAINIANYFVKLKNRIEATTGVELKMQIAAAFDSDE